MRHKSGRNQVVVSLNKNWLTPGSSKLSLWVGALLTLLVVAGIEGGQRLWFEFPSPFLLLFLSAIVIAQFGGLGGGLGSSVVAAVYTIYTTVNAKGLDPLSAEPLQFTLGISLVFLTATLLGHSRDRNRTLARSLQQLQCSPGRGSGTETPPETMEIEQYPTSDSLTNPGLAQIQASPKQQAEQLGILEFLMQRDTMERQQTEALLRQAYDDLELQVAQRTAELTRINQSLQAEIADRQQLEKQLRMFESVVVNVNDGVTISEAEPIEEPGPRIIYVNAAFTQMTGYTPEEVLGKSPRILQGPNTDRRQREKIRKALMRRESIRLELLNYRKDGSEFWVEMSIVPAIDDGGRCTHFISVQRDITQRRQAEQSLWETQRLLEQIADTTPTLIYIYDLSQDCHLYANRQTEAFLGCPQAEIKRMGSPFFQERLHPEDGEKRTQLKAQIEASQANEVFEQEYRLKNANGEWRWLRSWELVFTRTADGQPKQILGTAIDITEHKQAEQALLEERNFVSAILETAGALVVVLDLQGKIVRFNRACEQISQYKFDEVKGRCVWDLFILSKEIEPVKAIFERLYCGQYPMEYENKWQARDGTRRLISWSNTVLLDAYGAVKYIIATGLDITERKRAEEMRLKLDRERELSNLRLRFFSMASHEFRTPLSTILLSAQSLEYSIQDWSIPKRLKNIHRIQASAKHMTRLIEDILTINRAETGKLEFNPKRSSLEQVCQRAIEDFNLNQLNNITINFNKKGKEKKVYIDEKIMRFILNNLLSNAIKYSKNGGEISLTLTFEAQGATLQVSDGGIGIPEGEIAHLFEAFHRGSNIGSIAGSGLGLTVVKKCVELHGGKIDVTSQEGVGTTFTVTLPRQKIDTPDAVTR